MKKFIVVVILLGPLYSWAQLLKKTSSVLLPSELSEISVRTGDFDNDGLFDLFLIVQSDSSINGLVLQGDHMGNFSSPIISLVLNGNNIDIIDYDKDNRLDVISYGSPTVVYLNCGHFSFQSTSSNLPNFVQSTWYDFNNDGELDVIGSFLEDSIYYSVFMSSNTMNQFHEVSGALEMLIYDIQILDFNNDGNADIFLSGIDEDFYFSELLLNEGNFNFKKVFSKPYLSNASVGDLNGDGKFEIAFYSESILSSKTIQILQNSKDDEFSVDSIAVDISIRAIAIADYDADGVAEIFLTGTDLEKNEHEKLIRADSIRDLGIVDKVGQITWLDLNQDGNLDIIRLYKDDFWVLESCLNTSNLTSGPQAVDNIHVMPVFQRVLIYWDKTIDDLTNPTSLTYDLMIIDSMSHELMQSANFDLLLESRLIQQHGNNYTNNFKLLDNRKIGNQFYIGVQAVDNAFNPSSVNFFGSVNVLCESSIEIVKVVTCFSMEVSLSRDDEALWFSFKRGFLSKGIDFTQYPEEGDTLFSFVPNNCQGIVAYIFERKDSQVLVDVEKIVCAEEALFFSENTYWEKIEWSSKNQGILTNHNSLAYKTSLDDTLYVKMKKGVCEVFREIPIKVSKPQVLGQRHYVIFLHDEVQLEISGGQYYKWVPSETLSNDTIENPIAFPVETTHYTVHVYDSAGCFVSAEVVVQVEFSGFMPSLFTPNNDGNNDNLLIYGLNEVESFHLTIYARNGVLVYETTNIEEMKGVGWDGTYEGKDLPSGTYAWNVSGKFASGRDLLVNKGSSGNVLLVR